jgi:hypothetical protein
MVERQGWGEVKEGLGAPLRKVLEQRTGRPTIVRMADGVEIVVHDVSWGRDYGNMWEHVYANATPPRPDREIHFFLLSEVESLWDPDTGEKLIEQVPAPDES